ncbi:MAG: hypothetical protein AB8G11_19495 [Saprospiraceae bacterium]
METTIKKVNMEMYLASPNRYELRSGHEKNAPLCPYGNHYEWIGFDKETDKFVRFTKSVFKKLVREIEG